MSASVYDRGDDQELRRATTGEHHGRHRGAGPLEDTTHPPPTYLRGFTANEDGGRISETLASP